jgi:undecaprenyl-diphosphatase
MTIWEAVIIAIVEGLTEFLPVSSTGHMVITSSLMGIGKDPFTKLFEVAIQLGAILAVVVIYRKKFLQFSRWEFYVKLFVGVLPALVFGFLFNDAIDSMLGQPWVVAASILAGGVVLVYIDKIFPQTSQAKPDLLATETTVREVIEADDRLSYKKSLVIGCWQVISMIPGVSRSAASIIGGMQQKLTRNFAAEFSFFLAVPTMLAATLYSVFLKNWGDDSLHKKGYEIILSSKQILYAFIAGNIVAFIVAVIAIKFFISVLKRYGFRVFGIYRIILGLVLLALIGIGYL